MKTLLLIAAIILAGTFAKAQDIFFPTKEGTVLTYKTYNERDRETGMVRYTLTHITREGDNTNITYLIESIDKKDKTVFEKEMTIQQKGNKLYVDMTKFINKAALEQTGDIPAEMEITGNTMEIPSNLKVGDLLPNSNIEITFNVGFMSIKMGAEVTDRKVESMENIAVKAGNFEAYKITSKVTGNAMGVTTTSKSAEWLVKGLGMVKSEEYDKDGELNSYTEMVLIKE